MRPPILRSRRALPERPNPHLVTSCACISSKRNLDCFTNSLDSPASSGVWTPSQQEAYYLAVRNRTCTLCLFENLGSCIWPCSGERLCFQTPPHDNVKHSFSGLGSGTLALQPRRVPCCIPVQHFCILKAVVSVEVSRRKSRPTSPIDIPLHSFHRLDSSTFPSNCFGILYFTARSRKLPQSGSSVLFFSGGAFFTRPTKCVLLESMNLWACLLS